jgi:outer membrane receptor protein involved in Fe transport
VLGSLGAGGPSFSPFGDVSGKEILRQSPWQIAASLGYKAPVNERLDWYLRGDYSYRDEQFADATNQAITPDQTKLNMQIGLRSEAWTLELWGRNLTNEDGPSAATVRLAPLKATEPLEMKNGR